MNVERPTEAMAMPMWCDSRCPKCKKLVPVERHVFEDRVEYRCPYCQHRIEVVHYSWRKKEYGKYGRVVGGVSPGILRRSG